MMYRGKDCVLCMDCIQEYCCSLVEEANQFILLVEWVSVEKKGSELL